MTGEFRISLFFFGLLYRLAIGLNTNILGLCMRLYSVCCGGLLVTVGGSYNVFARTDARE